MGNHPVLGIWEKSPAFAPGFFFLDREILEIGLGAARLAL
jgi:hypothetical protein